MVITREVPSADMKAPALRSRRRVEISEPRFRRSFVERGNLMFL